MKIIYFILGLVAYGWYVYCSSNTYHDVAFSKVFFFLAFYLFFNSYLHYKQDKDE